MIRRRLAAVAAVAAASVLVVGGLAVADGTRQQATCTQHPTITEGKSVRSFTVTCSVPQQPQTTVTVTATPSASSSPSVSQSATPTSASPTASGSLNLPRIPWAGGAAYYGQFPNSAAFANPARFPVGIWYGNYDNVEQARWDVDHGINFHTQGNNSGVADPNALGDFSSSICFTEDELVGRNDNHAEVVKQETADVKACQDQGRVPYTNHTDQVIGDYGSANNTYFRQLINIGGIESLDEYYYALANTPCYASNRTYITGAGDAAHCSNASSYGNIIRQLQARDDAPLQPIFGFVENGAPIYQNSANITPPQMDGAVWSMIANGAAGIIYFNNSFSGPCVSSQVLRTAQLEPDGCYKAIAAQMKATNAAVQAVAPVLNTQSYRWDFGAAKTDTMLKTYNGSAYVFASVGVNGDAGSRTFTLPPGVAGSTVEVVGEGRTLPVSGGMFTDGFAAEYSHHTYRVSLG